MSIQPCGQIQDSFVRTSNVIMVGIQMVSLESPEAVARLARNAGRRHRCSHWPVRSDLIMKSCSLV